MRVVNNCGEWDRNSAGGSYLLGGGLGLPASLVRTPGVDREHGAAAVAGLAFTVDSVEHELVRAGVGRVR